MVSLGFLAELITAYQAGDEQSYSIAERTPEEKSEIRNPKSEIR